MKVQSIKFLIIFLFLVYFFIVFEANFHGPDEPLYFAYTASIVEDKDLNIVNNINPANTYYFPSGRIGITKTYNFPDYHNHGGVLFWAPAYLYGRLSQLTFVRYDPEGAGKYTVKDFMKCAMSFSTVFFALLTLLLTYFFCRIFFSRWTSFGAVLAVFFGTPFFVFTLFETGNANMLASLFSVLLIWFCSYMINMKRTDFFVFGLFFSLCIIIKSELAFQAVFILLIFLSLVISRRLKWINAGYFMAGIIPGVILRLANNFVKYGTIHISELGPFSIKNWYFLEQLFSSYRGFFYTSPVLYVCLLGLVFVFKSLLSKQRQPGPNDLQDRFFALLSSYLIIKLFVLSFRFAWGGGTPGARILCTEFLIFVLLFARAFQVKRHFKPLLMACAVVAILWNLVVIYEYKAGVDIQYALHAPNLSVRIHELGNIFRELLYVRNLNVKLMVGLPLVCLAMAAVFFLLKNIKRPPASFWYVKNHRPGKLFAGGFMLTGYICLSYSLVTVLNLAYNRSNVLKLQESGFFARSEILSKDEFEKLENVGSMNEMIAYFEAKGDTDRVNKIKIYKDQLYGDKENVRSIQNR